MAIKVVTIGGGTGHYMTLCACRLVPDIEITAIVSMADSGGSSGGLRDKYGALPPGDVLQCLLALSGLPGDVARDLLRRRFKGGPLDRDNAGNWLVTVLAQTTGSFVQAIRYLEQILLCRGHVLPVTVGNLTLHGRSRKGRAVEDEANFDQLNSILGPDDQIKEVWLKPNALVLGEAAAVLHDADYVVLSSGDLFSSVAPALLVNGVSEALARSRAKILCICNLVTTRGQTDGFTVPDFVDELERYARNRVDHVLFNTEPVDDDRARQYATQDQAYPVAVGDLARLEGRGLIGGDYLSESPLIRHSPRKLAEALTKLFSRI